ncbi:hypothetical protein BPOR_0758g00020 [Botrytis porri]|uniref:Uncharacterized protein n=1 Tax=Botrytis porri TaxID=87229 RepID=A0A4Z1KAZ5_9HELO|nr:hypothetical protein BPOR_0758g00020 [Botrytis porri]
MPPKRRPPPKLKYFKSSKLTQPNLDNSVSQTAASTTANAAAAHNDLSLDFASAKDDRTAPTNQLIFQAQGPLLASVNQEGGAEIDHEQVMRHRKMISGQALDIIKNTSSYGTSEANYARTYKKRPAEKTKSEKDETGSKPAPAKFDFPTEIIRLIFRSLIPEHQTFESDFCTAVCFALTCKPHWKIFRSIHSAKVSLLVQAPKTYNPKKFDCPYRLGDLLIKWMLPTYRPLPFDMRLEDTMEIVSTVGIDMFVSIAEYPDVGGEKDKRLATRRAGYQRNFFQEFYCIYHNIHSHGRGSFGSPAGLNWFVPNPFRMGAEWYPATVRFLKHTIFKWKSDCHMDREYHWLNDKEEYSRHYRVWLTYKTWMLRNWVEAQPEAMAYKRSRGLGEDKNRVGMRDGFEMLKLVDVQTKEHKVKVREVVDAMLKLVKGRPFYGEY